MKKPNKDDLLFETSHYECYQIFTEMTCSVWHKDGTEEYFRTGDYVKAKTIVDCLELGIMVMDLTPTFGIKETR